MPGPRALLLTIFTNVPVQRLISAFRGGDPPFFEVSMRKYTLSLFPNRRAENLFMVTGRQLGKAPAREPGLLTGQKEHTPKANSHRTSA